jgi:hypothetical protein
MAVPGVVAPRAQERARQSNPVALGVPEWVFSAAAVLVVQPGQTETARPAGMVLRRALEVAAGPTMAPSAPMVQGQAQAVPAATAAGEQVAAQ